MTERSFPGFVHWPATSQPAAESFHVFLLQAAEIRPRSQASWLANTGLAKDFLHSVTKLWIDVKQQMLEFPHHWNVT